MRGQIWATDSILGVAVLAFITLLSAFIWNSAASGNSQAEKYNDLTLGAMAASDAIVLTSGDPANWNHLPALDEDSVAAIGLAKSRNVLDAKKLERMQALNSSNYTLFRDRMGIPLYNYSISVLSLNGTEIWETGIAPPEDAQRVRVERFAVLEKEVVKVAVEIWE
ncbi:MAG: hypothetical protein PHS02_02345 [Candidatus ainarchaeum sp.]|nr:hypothetical protein [Candidatus ainarchaeum sp.]